MTTVTQTRPASTFIGYLSSICLAFLLLLNANQVAAQSGECIDTDGDGWGWDGSQSCTVVPATAAATNYCDDSDGDGWGWDGSQSCRVSTADENQSAGGSAGGNTDSDADCNDTDGDGWGWNGVSSCRTDTATSTGGNNNTGNLGTGNGSGAGNTGSTVTTSGPFDRSRDLIALHFDHAPDPDDAHAAAAAYVVTDRLGLNVLVVAGTYGVWSAKHYNSASESVMDAIWGGNWLNAHRSRNASVDQAVNRWVGTLAAGGQVWIAEGGPSDFSAAVVRKINQQYPEYNTRNKIHLVQHSDWNEDHSRASDVDFVKTSTHYIKIADGNDPNSTADLRVDWQGGWQSFVNKAASGPYARHWNAAFAYLSPHDKLDFSDSVELLHILGIGRNQISTIDDFARHFMD